MSVLSSKKMLLLGFIVIILIAIPLSVYVAQKQQQTKTQAAASTSLSFNPGTQTATAIGETINFDIMLDPGAGTPPNQVSFAKLVINYDPLKLATGDAGLTPTTAFQTVLEEPTYTSGSVSVTLSIGSDPSKAIQAKTKIATISFKALSPTDETKITFAGTTQVLSVASGDQAGENVLLASPSPATVKITAQVSPTAAPEVSGAPVSDNITCTGLGLDRAQNGNAPYSITFTGSANATNGTITKASFNFGDSPVEDVTQGGGIGTNNVSVQISHTYNNPGSYTATVILTGSDGAISSLSDNCTKVITVNPPVGGPDLPSQTGTESGQIVSPEVAPTIITQELIPSPIPSPIVPTGPSAKLIGIGVAGAILSIIGGLIFFTL